MKSRIRQNLPRNEQDVNLSPLIDVVFILLIFFIVSATFVKLPGIEVRSPVAETAESLEKNSILFALSSNNELHHAGQKVNLQEITTLIEQVDKKRDKPVVIQVDKWADASVLAKVISQARKARNEVSIATLKTEG